MKKILLLVVVLFSINSFSQEINYKEYSYSQFLELLKTGKDTVFKLENAIIKYDSIRDKKLLAPKYVLGVGIKKTEKKEKLAINKSVTLKNVQFINYQDYENGLQIGLNNIIFNKPVSIKDSFSLSLNNCEFKKGFNIVNFDYKNIKALKQQYPGFLEYNSIVKSKFSGNVRIVISYSANNIETNKSFSFMLGDNIFNESVSRTYLDLPNLRYVYIHRNTFNSLNPYYIKIEEANEVNITNNLFQKGLPQLYCTESEEFKFKDNIFNTPSLINLKIANNSSFIGNNSFNHKTGSLGGFDDFRRRTAEKYEGNKNWWDYNTIEYYKLYDKKDKIENLTSYQYELDQKSVFYNYFKERHNTTEANKYYIQIKDLENNRLVYEYGLEANFNKYFKIQINKFLKLFSNYGTEPERAVMVSLYVILFFAFIYLLFPNSWDTLGKRRLISRFEFFQKYLRRKEGMHTIYLEGKKEEISTYEDFKNNLENSKTELPSFFISWSKPLYNASMFSSRIKSRFLQNTDILKGKWKDLTPKQKRWKNIQIGFLLTLGLVYDLFIKALNALMLSINTFTTLGFGEIPIKGLPRYLAIIQGFIGWFMLTIFSVSLISQLLN